MFLFILFHRTTFGVEKPVFVSEKKQQQNKTKVDVNKTHKEKKQKKERYKHLLIAAAIYCYGHNQKKAPGG